MAELQDVLQRRRGEVRPEPGAFERLRRRRDRRRWAQAASTAIVVLILAALAVWGLTHAFSGRGSIPASPIRPDNVSRLHLAWSGGSAGAVGVAPVVSRHEVYATGFNLRAFRRSCAAETCEPAWVGNRGGGQPITDVAVGRNLVFASSAYVQGYPQGCVRQGASCDPTWVSSEHSISVGFTSLVVADGVVYAQGHQSIEAFPERCSLACEPLWRARLQAFGGQLVAVGGGLVFVQDESALKVFRSSCRSDGGLCKPLWKTANSSFGSQPLYSEGRVYVTRGIDEVAAYRARCDRGDDCPPETVWKVPDVIGIAVSGGHLYVATTQSILVFDTTCPTGAGCPTLWRTPDLGGQLSVPAVADGLVFFTAGDTVYAVREDCGSGGETCSPIWHERVPGTPGTLSPPTVTDRAVYVESSGGSLYAFQVPGG